MPRFWLILLCVIASAFTPLHTAEARTRVNSYGSSPGAEVPLLTPTTSLAETLSWKGKRLDPTGFYYLGARYYEPSARRFISADPEGHTASMSLSS